MPEELSPESADARFPIRSVWGVQAEVVQAMIGVLELEDSPMQTDEEKKQQLQKKLDTLFESVSQEGVDVAGISRIELVTSIRGYLLRRNRQLDLDTLKSVLLDDLRRQRDWLAARNNILPSDIIRRQPRSVQEAIREKYGEK